MPKCENCGSTKPESEGWIKSKGKWYCSSGCVHNAETLSKYKGKSGIASGLGQMADGALGGSLSADNIVGGAGKVALGGAKLLGKGLLGLGKLAGKGIAAGAGAVMASDAGQGMKSELKSLNPFARNSGRERGREPEPEQGIAETTEEEISDEVKFCTKCGAKLDISAAFCSKCGNKS
ncbi:zinc ribbon domain-containing protein [Treponema primitia]|uniref:zinc-ribbon domain-containing protein n=1 Tax=Treponema primitia TaxID=88058 RepID=UPI003981824A